MREQYDQAIYACYTRIYSYRHNNYSTSASNIHAPDDFSLMARLMRSARAHACDVRADLFVRSVIIAVCSMLHVAGSDVACFFPFFFIRCREMKIVHWIHIAF